MAMTPSKHWRSPTRIAHASPPDLMPRREGPYRAPGPFVTEAPRHVIRTTASVLSEVYELMPPDAAWPRYTVRNITGRDIES
jgi:hypothetical protein